MFLVTKVGATLRPTLFVIRNQTKAHVKVKDKEFFCQQQEAGFFISPPVNTQESWTFIHNKNISGHRAFPQGGFKKII